MSSSIPNHVPPSPSSANNALVKSSFATYVLSLLAYLLYLLWSILSTDFIENRLHIHWYPSQEWATLIPAWLTVTSWIVFITYLGRNIIVTPPIEGPEGLRSLTDDSAIVLDHFELPHVPSYLPHDQNYDPPVPILREVPCQVVNEFYFRKLAR
ncbi:PIG-P [Melampsora americana]|nr:PIG-P [Melampsora americana]